MATKTVHYASLTVNNEEVYGTAELINETGYAFRQDGERKAVLVSYTDVNLMLYGLCDVADAQYVDDEIRGGLSVWRVTEKRGGSNHDHPHRSPHLPGPRSLSEN